MMHGSMDEETSRALALLAFILLCLLSVYLGRPRRYRLPPGPQGLPLIGNVFDAPKEYNHLVFQEWGRRFGACLTPFCLDYL